MNEGRLRKTENKQWSFKELRNTMILSWGFWRGKFSSATTTGLTSFGLFTYWSHYWYLQQRYIDVNMFSGVGRKFRWTRNGIGWSIVTNSDTVWGCMMVRRGWRHNVVKDVIQNFTKGGHVHHATGTIAVMDKCLSWSQRRPILIVLNLFSSLSTTGC